MNLKYVFLWLAFIPFNPISAQKVMVIDFGGLEKMMQANDDTLRVFNFWATWCKPCVDELPYFIQAHENRKSEKLKVYLISLDFPRQIDTRLRPFIIRNKVSPPVYLLDAPNPNAWIDRVHPDWSGSIPATLLVKNGLKHFYEQEFTRDELNKLLNKHL
jgi:thiol-disulfide isomerase/thioredoxin